MGRFVGPVLTLVVGLPEGGCADRAPGSAPPSSNDHTTAPCSQIHRELSRWQGEDHESDECGPDLSGWIELTPLGGDQLLARRRLSAPDQLWQLTPDGRIAGDPIDVPHLGGAVTAGFTRLPGPEERVLAYDPRSPQWTLYHVQVSAAPRAPVLTAAESGLWGSAGWKIAGGAPAGHQFIGLEDGYVLDRDLGTGVARAWRFVSGPNGNSEVRPPDDIAGSASDDLRRGHRLVHLAPHRLLEWIPAPCAAAGACAGASFHVWDYTLDEDGGARISFDPTAASSGFWPEIGADHDIVADDAHLFVWTRASGELRSYALNPEAADPLSGAAHVSPADERLRTAGWTPPTRSPSIKHLLLVLQDGRSFDSYFGRYCRGGATADGAPLQCEDGADCCESMPGSIAGAETCAPFGGATDAYRPDDAPACLRAKMNEGAMDGFTVTPAAGGCGDPKDFACAGAGADAGAVAAYHRLALEGALSDRFFQSYAFLGGEGATPDPAAPTPNFLYLVTARFPGELTALIDTPLMTRELSRMQIAWAVYAGPKNLAAMSLFGIPIFFDPDWFPYRSLEEQELEHDMAAGQLPTVSVVLPDAGDPARSEAPGHAVGPGIDYVQHLVNLIDGSPYRDDTLVLLAYLSAGGYYDHVPPPPPPPLDVDASSGIAANARAVQFGPRVPFLAVGRFARRNHISHAQLEMSSIAVFIEWNWLRGNGLKGVREPADRRRYRDTTVNNLGSLLDAGQAGVEVPSGHN